MTIFRNKYFTGVLWILVYHFTWSVFLTHAYSYFNTKALNITIQVTILLNVKNKGICLRN